MDRNELSIEIGRFFKESLNSRYARNPYLKEVTHFLLNSNLIDLQLDLVSSLLDKSTMNEEILAVTETGFEKILHDPIMKIFFKEEIEPIHEDVKILEEKLYLADEKIKNRVLECMVCPITQEVMREPVIIETGISYDRFAIETRLHQIRVCPVTNQVIRNQNNLIENFAIKYLCQAYWEEKIIHENLLDEINLKKESLNTIEYTFNKLIGEASTKACYSIGCVEMLNHTLTEVGNFFGKSGHQVEESPRRKNRP